MRSEQPIALVYHGSAEDYVDGTLVWGVNLTEAEQAQQDWDAFRAEMRELGIAVDEKERDHIHWDWRRKATSLKRFNGEGQNWRLAGILSEEQWQGLMILWLNKLGRLESKPLVYVDYLMSAPWNRPVTPRPRFRGVGQRLIRAAIEESQKLGYAGRIALHSLPEAEEFYAEKCGMTDFGSDSTYYDLCYFELTAEQAERFLNP